ncbi:hypothetical protein HII31_00809 [Pseudocercospora fuligena]|uniref:Uncharacterized protein n=1 Tax=Pseudocercospora fuligena TaxID=685502 RepID=A0A8H6VT13_9PEZI|nr:hypothetical protein HII31_00809 [Pseudocercospora fuligena]
MFLGGPRGGSDFVPQKFGASLKSRTFENPRRTMDLAQVFFKAVTAVTQPPHSSYHRDVLDADLSRESTPEIENATVTRPRQITVLEFCELEKALAPFDLPATPESYSGSFCFTDGAVLITNENHGSYKLEISGDGETELGHLQELRDVVQDVSRRFDCYIHLDTAREQDRAEPAYFAHPDPASLFYPSNHTFFEHCPAEIRDEIYRHACYTNTQCAARGAKVRALDLEFVLSIPMVTHRFTLELTKISKEVVESIFNAENGGIVLLSGKSVTWAKIPDLKDDSPRFYLSGPTIDASSPKTCLYWRSNRHPRYEEVDFNTTKGDLSAIKEFSECLATFTNASPQLKYLVNQSLAESSGTLIDSSKDRGRVKCPTSLPPFEAVDGQRPTVPGNLPAGAYYMSNSMSMRMSNPDPRLAKYFSFSNRLMIGKALQK